MKITIEQLEFTLCIKEKINKIPNKKQSKVNKDKYPLLQINTQVCYNISNESEVKKWDIL